MKQNILLTFSILILGGCAAVGVPYTSDPNEKLYWTNQLLMMGRALPAERLIVEAVEICQKNNDTECLGNAYSMYGFFFTSGAVERYSKKYKEDGFRDKKATYNERYNRSKEYYEKAITEFSKTNKYDLLTNTYVLMADTYHALRDKAAECKAYKTSVIYNKKNFEANPTTNIYLPKGYSTFEEYIDMRKEQAKCNDKNVGQIVNIIINGVLYTPSIQRSIKSSYLKRSMFESTHSGHEEDKTPEFILLMLKKASFNSLDKNKDSSIYDIYITIDEDSEDPNVGLSVLSLFLIPVTSTYRFDAEVTIKKDGKQLKSYRYTTDVERQVSQSSEVQAYRQEAIQIIMTKFLKDIEYDSFFINNPDKTKIL